jgi:hypothetical protein
MMAKRNNQVFNRAQAKAGKRLLKWAASGCNWANGPYKASIQASAKKLLARGPVFAALFASVAHSLEVEALTQSGVSALVLAAVGQSRAEELRQEADEREGQRPSNAGWTYDSQTDWLIEIANGCDKMAAKPQEKGLFD